MNATKLLYYDHPYQQTARSTVVETLSYKQQRAVILDQTIFYPEGGGQPGDKGFIDDVVVLDTQKDESGRIFHIIDSEREFSVGQQVDLTLDWNHRYHYMQQHTSQHLLSGALFRLFGIGTVSVHFGETEFSIELDTPTISSDHITLLEDEINAIINSGVETSEQHVTQSDVKEISLRRPVKVEGDVRLISVGEYDTIACGGIHVANSSELKYVQYVRSEMIRNHQRTFWIGGDYSISLIRRNNAIVNNVGTLLSSPPNEIEQLVENLQKERVDLQYHLNKSYATITSLLLEKEIEDNIAVFDASLWDEHLYKNIGESVLHLEKISLCVIKERSDKRLMWSIAIKGRDDAQRLFQTIKEEALVLIDAKGGGKEPLWQGVGNNIEGKEAFLQSVKKIFNA
ncbi:MAG: alanyl-tRNA editing protein [Sphaerochaetaceae bacterium]|jgi:alanyl-tRNA synthetase